MKRILKKKNREKERLQRISQKVEISKKEKKRKKKMMILKGRMGKDKNQVRKS